MPTEIPIWRKVVLTPEAMPERSGADNPHRRGRQGRVDQARAKTREDETQHKWVQVVVPVSPLMSSSPTPTSASPGPISHLMGTRLVKRPAMVADTNVPPLNTSSRAPVRSAEKPRSYCRYRTRYTNIANKDPFMVKATINPPKT